MATEQELNNSTKGIDVFKRICLFGLEGFGLLCLFLALINQWHENPLKNITQLILGVECSNATDLEDVAKVNEIQKILDVVRNKIRDDMTD